MRTVPMCLSIWQVPRCRIHTLAKFWQESFHSLHRSCRNNSSFRLLCSKANGPEGGYNRRWIRRPVSTKTEGTNKNTQNSSKSTSIGHEVLDETVSTSVAVNVKKNEISELPKTQCSDSQQKFPENVDLANLLTVIVFDLETTGFSRENERIIEIALQDLEGGENSTFQTLVNPERYVPNSNIHGITTHMVCRPGIPRMEELIPILLQYIESRQKPGGYVLLVAHNARIFDVPFLTNEFSRCGADIPSNWLFVDTVPLARQWMKSEGLKLSSRVSLEVLRETFGIKLSGSAHRAMSDVKTLSLVFQRLAFDLKLTLRSLVEKSFKSSDLTSVKKKKNDSS